MDCLDVSLDVETELCISRKADNISFCTPSDSFKMRPISFTLVGMLSLDSPVPESLGGGGGAPVKEIGFGLLSTGSGGGASGG